MNKMSLKDLVQSLGLKKKAFITGMSRCGKSSLAKEYATFNNIPYIEFDKTFNFNTGYDRNYVQNYLNNLPSSFIIDGVPFELGTSIEYILKNDATLICTICSNPLVWLNRMFHSEGIIHYIKDKEVSINIKEGVKIFNKAILDAYFDCASFYYKTLNIYNGIPYLVFDSFNNSFIKKEEIREKLKWIEVVFNSTLDRSYIKDNMYEY